MTAPNVADAPHTIERHFTCEENQLITQALSVLERRLFQYESLPMQSPRDVADFLRLKLSTEEREVFYVLFLDNRHRLLAHEPLFWGTIDGAQVAPRIVLQQVLRHNCACIIMAHNHPSGCTKPSSADRTLTRQLQDLLAQIDVRVLDHFIIGEGEPLSFASQGLL